MLNKYNSKTLYVLHYTVITACGIITLFARIMNKFTGTMGENAGNKRIE